MSAGLHCDRRMSRHMLPLELILGWYILVVNATCAGERERERRERREERERGREGEREGERERGKKRGKSPSGQEQMAVMERCPY